MAIGGGHHDVHNHNSWYSKEDQTTQISKTIFVTNFPDHIHARDLWGLCKEYGSVFDVYIPFKKSKEAQNQSVPPPSNPALVLDDSCLKERDFSNSIMGQVKEVTAIPNIFTILFEEGFQSTKFTYLGVYWIRAKELDAWVPKFFSNNDSSSSKGGFYKSDKRSKFKDKEFDNVKRDNDNEKVSETSGMQENKIGNDNEPSIHGEENLHSNDPFNIYELLQKKKDNIHQSKEWDPIHPLGFTPEFGNNNKEEGFNSVQRKSVSGKKIFSYHNVDAFTHHTTCMPVTPPNWVALE
ncbi:RNA-directed DNA polymerase, eukaryota [Tanacetum coccineum]